MATTVIFIEIMIIGLFATAWVILLLARIGVVAPQTLIGLLSQANNWNTLVLVVLGAVAYQLGSLTNTLCYGLMEQFAVKKIRASIIPTTTDYQAFRATIFHQGSAQLVSDITSHLTYIRLARAAILNFALLGLTLLLYGARFWLAGVLCILLAIGCFFIWRIIFKLDQKSQAAAYVAIQKSVAGSLQQQTVPEKP